MCSQELLEALALILEVSIELGFPRAIIGVDPCHCAALAGEPDTFAAIATIERPVGAHLRLDLLRAESHATIMA